MKRILVPTDGSPLSERAIPVAETIAREQGAEIVLVRVVEPTNTPVLGLQTIVAADLSDEIEDAFKLTAQQELVSIAESIANRGGQARAMVIVGSAALGLLDAERQVEPDLVVIASHGRTGLARVALGSVAEKLVREGSAPVLVVHGSSPTSRALETALVSLDGSPLSETALAMVETLARAPLRQARLLRVVDEPRQMAFAQSYLESIATRLERRGLLVSTETIVGEPADVIQTVSRESDLLVIATHGRRGFDRLRHGSVAEQVTRHVQTPVLLVRARAQVVPAAGVEASIAAAG